MQRTGSSFGIIVALIAFLSAGLFMAGSAMAASVGEGDDLEIGGQGVGEGKFGHIQDITFDGQSKLYVLDGAAWDIRQKQLDGNLLVQKFSNDGKFISQFPIKGDGRGEQNLPQRIAVDQTGRVYLTVPGKDRVECYDAEGKPSGIYEAPGAMGITIWKHKSFGKGAERIAVIGGVRRIVGGKNAIVGGDVVHVIEPGKPGTTQIKLEQPAGEVVDLASGADGLLYIKPAAPTIIKVDDAGKTVQVIGSGKQSRAEDGSELLHTVALDSTGRIYSMTFGNPGRVAMFSSDFKNVSLRDGQFKWADPWSTHSQYVAMAVDTSDRVWLAVPEPIPANDPHYATRHFKPVVLRIQKGFFDPSMRVTQQSTKMLGLLPSLKSVLPYSIAYDLKPIEMQLSAPASNRNIDQVELKYVVYDMYKNKVSDGQLDLKLEAGKEAVARFNFTPPAYGWYTTECQLINQGELLTTMGAHVGVTPRFAGMVALSEGESKGGWEDAPRQMFVGLSNMRLHPKQNLDEMDASVALAEKYGATFFVQLTGDAKLLTPEFVRPILERFKGRVKYWEPVNEPNFSSNPEKLVEAYKWFYPMVKEIDPRAKVMGPAVCGIQLPLARSLLQGRRREVPRRGLDARL